MVNRKKLCLSATDFQQRIALFKMMWRHRKLAEKRSLSFQQNKIAQIVMWVGIVFGLIYMAFLAILFSLLVQGSTSMTSLEFICSIIPFILAADFMFSLTTQEAPAQLVKPYILLPISKYTCIDNFIGLSFFKASNFIWYAFIIPYLLMSVLFSFGIWISLGVLIFYTLLIYLNRQVYDITRILTTDSVFWWLLPIGIFAILASPWYLGKDAGIENLLSVYATIGTLIEANNPLPYLASIVLLIALIVLNRHIQYTHITSELENTEKTNASTLKKLSLFENYGDVGTYLQLEIQSILRNKNPRKTFIGSMSIVILFSLLLAFTDVYDGNFSTNFFGFYNFVIFGAMSLSRIMDYEGNYIDCLIVQKENILSLLKAKYLFYVGMLIMPLILMLPTVFSGKFDVLQIISYAVFTAGFQYFLLFQLAVYNKQCTPLNKKFINKNYSLNNYRQSLINIICLTAPVAFMSVLQIFLNNFQIYILLIVIGSLFVCSSPWWLRNIYNRMMHKKYELLEGFQASR